jgi:carbamoyltransferase
MKLPLVPSVPGPDPSAALRWASDWWADDGDGGTVDTGDAPYMIRTFDVRPDRRPDLEAVSHPADDTTRPQTVTPESNPRYHRLLDAFADRTGLPVLLNTSFNDHGEPIVDTPKQALTDFYRMGLDVLVLEEAVLTKPGWDD